MHSPTKSSSASGHESDSYTSTPRALTGRILDGRYQLMRFLGRGGMGSVFLAKHVVIGRTLAVKVLDASRVGERREYSRLFREAQTAAAIGHPNIIEVLDVGVAPQGSPYLVMEYLEGEDVASVLRRQGALPARAACAIVEPVLLALQAAHARNIIHRDIKPANIFIVRRTDSPPVIKLIDFGIAKELGPSRGAKLTQPGAVLGTPSYMPPEQATGVEDVDPRADIYGVGISLYEMVTDSLPFEGANYNETLYKIVTDSPKRPESPIEELPASLVDIIERAMHRDPEQRFQSPAEMLEALKALELWPDRAQALAALAAELKPNEPNALVEAATQVSPESPGMPVNERDKLPSDFVETVAEGASLQPRASVTRTGAPWLFTSAAALSLAALVYFVLWLRSDELPDPSVASSKATAQPPDDHRVTITISGVPRGATVVYDGKPVRENPFRVPATQTMMPLRVEAEGYEPFVLAIVPTRDTIVRADMKREPSGDRQTPPPAPSVQAEERPTDLPLRASHGKPTPSSSANSAVRKSARGTYYTEKFE